jgi:hypothetical protein
MIVSSEALPCRARVAGRNGARYDVSMAEALSFRLGHSDRAHVIVTVTPRPTTERIRVGGFDANWVDATIRIAAGAFAGEYAALLRADDFVRFRDQLRPLYEQLAGAATFATLEGWLSIEVRGDGKGHFQAKCEAIDEPGVGSRLAFNLDFDQTELPETLRQLDAICDAVPVIAGS